MIRTLFFNSERQWRNGWWIAFFFLMLAVLLFPLLIWSQQASFELTPWYQALLILVVTGVCQRLRGEPLAPVVGVFSVQRLHDAWRGVAAGVLLMALPAAVLWAMGLVQFERNVLTPVLFWQGISASLAVAMAEELLFRGFIFQRLLAGVGTWPAQLLIAAYFVLTHSQNPGMSGMTAVMAGINIFIASLVFGFAYLRTQSVVMPIAMHFAANWMQGSVLGFGVSGNQTTGFFAPLIAPNREWLTGGMFGLEASLLGLISICLLALILMPKNTARW